MGHIPVSHPAGRLEVVPICSRQIGRRASRYDPFATLSLIMGFVSSLKAPEGAFLFLIINRLFVFLFHSRRFRLRVGFRRHANAFDSQLDFRGNQIAQHAVHLEGVLTNCIADIVDVAFFTLRRLFVTCSLAN